MLSINNNDTAIISLHGYPMVINVKCHGQRPMGEVHWRVRIKYGAHSEAFNCYISDLCPGEENYVELKHLFSQLYRGYRVSDIYNSLTHFRECCFDPGYTREAQKAYRDAISTRRKLQILFGDHLEQFLLKVSDHVEWMTWEGKYDRSMPMRRVH